jgi:hypothetical protein
MSIAAGLFGIKNNALWRSCNIMQRTISLAFCLQLVCYTRQTLATESIAGHPGGAGQFK